MKNHTKMSSLRWCSTENPWIDVVVIVQDSMAKVAFEAMQEAYRCYWDEAFECYGDALHAKLKAAGVSPYWTVFHDSERTDEEYESQWEALVAGITAFAPRYGLCIGIDLIPD